ncbi:MAG: hypothetical protein WCF90_01250 [Methanomicrobiales archaeon]
MVKPTEIFDKVQQVLSPDDWKIVKTSINNIHLAQGRHVRKTNVSDLDHLLVDTAIKTNTPTILYALSNVPSNEIEDLFSSILSQYIKTKDGAWLKSLLFLSNVSEKKIISHVFLPLWHGISLSQEFLVQILPLSNKEC